MITGLLLAGGAGRRVGYRDKGTLPWQGEPLAAHSFARMAPQVGKVMISCNRNRGFYLRFGCELIADLREDYQGPLAGLEAAAVHCNTDYLLLAPCDTPRLPENLGQRLAAALADTPSANISYARAAGRDHFLCALLRQHCLHSLGPFLDNGGRAVRHWFAEQCAIAVDFPDEDNAFLNINSEASP
ncbi:molybdenum cofactor guanylyltransferase [Halioglobus maricola]|uniref:Molybdenum cofactor guanylyltransferase n=2 Tax=Halioglobus maricola TaxID=2601894 RepID=A0A5P9NQG6_9GAMM|nr:molybdenum cofactor guanylyltransferase [Halioglobus maricola]